MTLRVKVSFPLPLDEGGSVERMYAQPLENGRYLLDNSPFYVFDISYCDEFSVVDLNGEKVFSQITARGGHSTYRVMLPAGKDHNYFLKYWGELQDLGCTFEGSSVNTQLIYAIDMPPNVDIHKAYAIMESNEHQGIWSFEEGHYYNSSKLQ